MPTPNQQLVKFEPSLEARWELPREASWPAAFHQFDQKSVWAIQAALACGRPLLVRGEAGVGKSQLARAAAAVLDWPFLSYVVHGRTEPEDLLYTFDAVARLAKAQIARETGQSAGTSILEASQYVRPGPFWWAINWTSARDQANRWQAAVGGPSQQTNGRAPGEPESARAWKAGLGCVLLIDEIDKAEADVPNALLEPVGNSAFQVPILGTTVSGVDANGEGSGTPQTPPLIIITTNEDRELPPAFLRRCLVLQMDLGEGKECERRLVARGQLHFPKLPELVIQKAAERLTLERATFREEGTWKPGAAELLDLLRVLASTSNATKESMLRRLDEIADFGFRKNPQPPAGTSL